MKRMLILEFKNCLNRKEFQWIFAIIMLVSIGGFLLACADYYGAGMMTVRSAYEMSLLQSTSTWTVFSTLLVLLPLLAVIIYSDSHYSDVQSGVYKSIITRVDHRIYVWAKAIVLFVVTFCTFFIPLLVNQALCLVTFPVQGWDNNYAFPPYDIGFQNFDPTGMFDLLRLQSPMLFNLLFMVLVSFIAAMFALLAYGVYFVVNKGKFPVVAGLFLFYVASDLAVGFLGSYRLTLNNLLLPGNTGSFSNLLVWIVALLLPSLTLILRKTIGYKTDVE